MNLGHILLTTDLSEASLEPRQQVAGLARRHAAKVTLLHVARPDRVVPGEEEDEGPDPEVAERLEELRTELSDDLEVHVVALEAANVAEAIAEWAEANKVDLIALTTHGRTGLKHIALGSVAEAVVRHADLPVLVFPISE